MTDHLTPGPAIECAECGRIEPTDDPTMPCPTCEDAGRDPFCTTAVALTLCPAAVGDDCTDDAHHFGLGLHVTEVAP